MIYFIIIFGVFALIAAVKGPALERRRRQDARRRREQQLASRRAARRMDADRQVNQEAMPWT